MPVDSISEAPENLRELDGAKLTLSQINHILRIYDALKEEGDVENPMAVAISQFKETYEKVEDSWEKKEETKIGRRVRQSKINDIRQLRKEFKDIKDELSEFEEQFEEFLNWAEYADEKEENIEEQIGPGKTYELTIPKGIAPLEGKLFVSPKVCGERVVLAWCEEERKCLSISDDFESCKTLPYTLNAPECILEGILSVKSEEEWTPNLEENQHYWLYDIVYHNGKSLENVPYEDRLKTLRSLELPNDFTVLAQRPIVSEDQLEKVVEWANSRPMSAGAYVRKANAPYEFGETPNVLLIKKKIQVKAKVLEDSSLGLSDATGNGFLKLGGTVSEEYGTNDIVNVEIGSIHILKGNKLVWKNLKVIEPTSGPTFTVGQAINLARDAGILREEVPLKTELDLNGEKNMYTFNGELTDAEFSDIGKKMKAAHNLNDGLVDALESCRRKGVYSTIKTLSRLEEEIKKGGAFGFVKASEEFSFPMPSSINVGKISDKIGAAIMALDQEDPDFKAAENSIGEALEFLGYEGKAVEKVIPEKEETKEEEFGLEDEIPTKSRNLEVKIYGEDEERVRIGGYLVKWGNPEETDLVGDYFTPNTDIGMEIKAPLIFHHGMDASLKTSILGERTKAVKDDVGVWVEHWVNKANEFWKFVDPLLKTGLLYYSPGSAPHLVQREENGELKMFWAIEDSLTPTPCQYRLRPVEQIKTAFEEAGLEFNIPSDEKNNDDTDLEEELSNFETKFNDMLGG